MPTPVGTHLGRKVVLLYKLKKKGTPLSWGAEYGQQGVDWIFIPSWTFSWVFLYSDHCTTILLNPVLSTCPDAVWKRAFRQFSCFHFYLPLGPKVFLLPQAIVQFICSHFPHRTRPCFSVLSISPMLPNSSTSAPGSLGPCFLHVKVFQPQCCLTRTPTDAGLPVRMPGTLLVCVRSIAFNPECPGGHLWSIKRGRRMSPAISVNKGHCGPQASSHPPLCTLRGSRWRKAGYWP